MRLLPFLLLLLLPAAGEAQTPSTTSAQVSVTIPPVAHIREVTPFEMEDSGECCVLISRVSVQANTSYRLLVSANRDGVTLLGDEREVPLVPGRPLAIESERTTRVHELRIRVGPEVADTGEPLEIQVVAN